MVVTDNLIKNRNRKNVEELKNCSYLAYYITDILSQ